MVTQGFGTGRLTRCALLVIILLAGGGPAGAQMVMGRVVEEGTEQPIAAVTIELTDTSGLRRGSAVSDTAGSFSVMAPQPGRYRLRVTHVAYAAVQTRMFDAAAGQQVELELRMHATAVPLEPLRVVGQSDFNAGWLQEYYDRAAITRRSGIGRVFFRDEVEREHVPFASAFLIYLMPRGNCRPTLFVDGLEVQDARHLDTLMRPDIIEGVELYNSAAFLPQKYANRGHCAIALFWTRRDIEGGRPFSWKRLLAAGGLLTSIFLLFRM
jgi:hypothetical protein